MNGSSDDHTYSVRDELCEEHTGEGELGRIGTFLCIFLFHFT